MPTRLYALNNTTRQHPRASTNRAARLVKRVFDTPDADMRCAALLARLEVQFDIDPDELDRALGKVIDLTAQQVGLLRFVRGA
jgi:hypothetical protein